MENGLADSLSRNKESFFVSGAASGQESISHTTGGSRGSGHPLDIHSLDPAVQQYYSAALTDSTHKTYRAAGRRYNNFCIDFAVPSIRECIMLLCSMPWPAGPEPLDHKDGVRQVQISLGFPEPRFQSMPRLHQMIRGVQVVRVERRVELPGHDSQSHPQF